MENRYDPRTRSTRGQVQGEPRTRGVCPCACPGCPYISLSVPAHAGTFCKNGVFQTKSPCGHVPVPVPVPVPAARLFESDCAGTGMCPCPLGAREILPVSVPVPVPVPALLPVYMKSECPPDLWLRRSGLILVELNLLMSSSKRSFGRWGSIEGHTKARSTLSRISCHSSFHNSVWEIRSVRTLCWGCSRCQVHPTHP